MAAGGGGCQTARELGLSGTESRSAVKKVVAGTGNRECLKCRKCFASVNALRQHLKQKRDHYYSLKQHKKALRAFERDTAGLSPSEYNCKQRSTSLDLKFKTAHLIEVCVT